MDSAYSSASVSDKVQLSVLQSVCNDDLRGSVFYSIRFILISSQEENGPGREIAGIMLQILCVKGRDI